MHRRAAVSLDLALLRRAVKEKMREDGTTQSELADGTGLLKSTVSRFLGGRAPTIDAVLSFCSWLGARVERFARRAK